ncbi:polymer-forming cytoskeletal protein [Paenibacillus sp. JX-17]|uniref:Polymer-forming cytoskeletal protein n=1 Tax=Paenibacillus lacisoli TaxID=3064525 RepID=A0ABT9CHY2_9BACL|nr:polymer-forming cytoskeletal protein [Paenibacillus sp. JX-17]MDO7907213.1 polymer-forming cytoskeletal protein [Paenibacillus sp. JX-17]
MFKETKRTAVSTDTLIGQGTEIQGSLHCSADLRIEGRLIGDIVSTRDVIIGESSILRSCITARNVIIAGKVFGDITAEGKLTIMASGKLYGNIQAKSLIVAEGGVFNGTSGGMEETEETEWLTDNDRIQALSAVESTESQAG